jgi:hypothetical protein
MSALSDSTIRALQMMDEDPVWGIFVDIFCSGNEPLSTEGHEWSPHTLDAMKSAALSAQRSQELMEASIVSAAEVYGTFNEIQDEVFEYVFDGPHRETILAISCGPNGKERDVFVVTQFKERYIALSAKIGLTGPHASLDNPLSLARSFVSDFGKGRLISIIADPKVPTSFLDEIVMSACPETGMRFSLEDQLCERSVENAFFDIV